MMGTMVILFIACIVLLFAGIPLAYLRGRYASEIKTIGATIRPELPPVRHECLFGPWSDKYTEKYMDGWRPTKSEYQSRNCLGCNIEEIREVVLGNVYEYH